MRFGSFLRLTAILSAVHFVLALSSFFVAFSYGMERFDAATSMDQGLMEATASAVSNILWQPLLALWNALFVGRSGPWLLQWFALALNSVIWGAILAWAIESAKSYLQAK
jgi:hypothetical protein